MSVRLRLPTRMLRSRGLLFLFVLAPIVIVHLLHDRISRHVGYPLPHFTGVFGGRTQPLAGLGAHDDAVERQQAVLAHGDAASFLKSPDTSMPNHTYLDSGLVVPNPKGRHPIFDLIVQARAQWQAKLDTSSKTLADAVDEYRRRYGRSPPRGFDRWFNWASKNNVQLLDEYDQIHTDLEPFWALTPAQMRKLSAEAATMDNMYTLSCKKNGDRTTCSYKLAKITDEGHIPVATERAEAQLELIRPIENDLEDIEAVFYSHDVPWQFVGHDYKENLIEAAALGEYYEPDEGDLDPTHLGWASACAPHKPLRKSYNSSLLPDLEGRWTGAKSFVKDHKATMDACVHPELVHLTGFLSSHGKGPGPSTVMYPIMAMCKTTLHSDVLGVSAEAWTEDVLNDPEWEDKAYDKMMWRGKTTGILYRPSNPWNISQRINLVDHAARREGSLAVYDDSAPSAPVGNPVTRSYRDLNGRLMNVAFVDDPIQCEEPTCTELKEYRFASRLDWAQGNQFKYLLDIDGNGWSARFKRLMSTNSVVLKSTIFPEWYTDRVQPWVHYIPIKPDLTDLYDVMAFFHDGHDELAKEIATEGKKWSKTFWRMEDMVSYQFRLFLELSRLLADKRTEASFNQSGDQLRHKPAGH